MSKQGGDDLDDDFVPDDLVSLSEDEDAGQSAEGEDIAAFLSAGEENEAQESRAQGTSTSVSEKKRKRRAKEKERRAKVSGNSNLAGCTTLMSSWMIHDTRNAECHRLWILRRHPLWPRSLLCFWRTICPLYKPRLSLRCQVSSWQTFRSLVHALPCYLGA